MYFLDKFSFFIYIITICFSIISISLDNSIKTKKDFKMTSMEFFRHLETKPSAPIDWGTTEPRHIPLDSSLNRAPTFLQKYSIFK